LRIENALTLDALEAAEEAQRAALLAPPDALLGELPAQQLNEENARAILHGQRIRAPQAEGAAGLCRLYRQAVFLGLGEVRADGFVYAKRLLASVD
ncbi:MAG: tRNA pseudouridine(55) synthase TruB, partial [Rhodocyclaceae bacterium]|nr:tRNA pseudouridine(55) synthase TruB [Rhodocyclaceae bacterium]